MARNFDPGKRQDTATSPLQRWLLRYSHTQCVGAEAWARLLAGLAPFFPGRGALHPGSSRDERAALESLLAAFIEALRPQRRRRRPRRVFIAHALADLVEARRLAHFANAVGLASWLEADDCQRLDDSVADLPLGRALALAAQEMALCNCSQVLIVVDGPVGVADGSGYLLGRARDHTRLVGACARWSSLPCAGEWRSLTPVLHDDADIWHWLQGQGLAPHTAAATPWQAAGERRQPEHRRARWHNALNGLRAENEGRRGSGPAPR